MFSEWQIIVNDFNKYILLVIGISITSGSFITARSSFTHKLRLS